MQPESNIFLPSLDLNLLMTEPENHFMIGTILKGRNLLFLVPNTPTPRLVESVYTLILLQDLIQTLLSGQVLPILEVVNCVVVQFFRHP